MTNILGSPVFGVGLTVGVYLLASVLYRRVGHPLLTPVLVTITVVAAAIKLLGIDYATYFASVQVIHLLLGPATVALALPLVRAGRSLHEALIPVLVSVGCGCLVAIGTVWGLARVLGADHAVVLALLPRSVTTPVALGLSDIIGASGPLAAVFAITAGVIGAVLGPSLLNLVRITDPRARGLGIGVAAHGIGTGRALQESGVAGSWSSAGMVLNALATSVVLPALMSLRLL